MRNAIKEQHEKREKQIYDKIISENLISMYSYAL
jgi:hypothetical protein